MNTLQNEDSQLRSARTNFSIKEKFAVFLKRNNDKLKGVGKQMKTNSKRNSTISNLSNQSSISGDIHLETDIITNRVSFGDSRIVNSQLAKRLSGKSNSNKKSKKPELSKLNLSKINKYSGTTQRLATISPDNSPGSKFEEFFRLNTVRANTNNTRYSRNFNKFKNRNSINTIAKTNLNYFSIADIHTDVHIKEENEEKWENDELKYCGIKRVSKKISSPKKKIYFKRVKRIIF